MICDLRCETADNSRETARAAVEKRSGSAGLADGYVSRLGLEPQLVSAPLPRIDEFRGVSRTRMPHSERLEGIRAHDDGARAPGRQSRRYKSSRPLLDGLAAALSGCAFSGALGAEVFGAGAEGAPARKAGRGRT